MNNSVLCFFRGKAEKVFPLSARSIDPKRNCRGVTETTPLPAPIIVMTSGAPTLGNQLIIILIGKHVTTANKELVRSGKPIDNTKNPSTEI